MTPAIRFAQQYKIAHTIHSYQHDPQCAAYGLEAAEKLSMPPSRVFKTLLAQLDDRELLVVIVPVAAQLNMKLLAKAAGGRKAAMADKVAVEKTTGYVLGGISPLGQKKKLRTFLHQAALAQTTILVSAGRRGLEIELAPADLLRATKGTAVPLCLES